MEIFSIDDAMGPPVRIIPTKDISLQKESLVATVSEMSSDMAIESPTSTGETVFSQRAAP